MNKVNLKHAFHSNIYGNEQKGLLNDKMVAIIDCDEESICR